MQRQECVERKEYQKETHELEKAEGVDEQSSTSLQMYFNSTFYFNEKKPHIASRGGYAENQLSVPKSCLCFEGIKSSIMNQIMIK